MTSQQWVTIHDAFPQKEPILNCLAEIPAHYKATALILFALQTFILPYTDKKSWNEREVSKAVEVVMEGLWFPIENKNMVAILHLQYYIKMVKIRLWITNTLTIVELYNCTFIWLHLKTSLTAPWHPQFFKSSLNPFLSNGDQLLTI